MKQTVVLSALAVMAARPVGGAEKVSDFHSNNRHS
jgi:hypothetical protein